MATPTITLSSRSVRTLTRENGEYLVNFGDLYQGRTVEPKAPETGPLPKDTVDLIVNLPVEDHSESFQISFLDSSGTLILDENDEYTQEERRVGAEVLKDYANINSPGRIRVRVGSVRLGAPGANERPKLRIFFPESEQEIFVSFTWYNYWVTVNIITDDEEYPNKLVGIFSETKTHVLRAVRVKVNDSVGRSIPKNESPIIEVLVENPDQMPVPIQKLDEATGDFDTTDPTEVDIIGMQSLSLVINPLRDGEDMVWSNPDTFYLSKNHKDYLKGDGFQTRIGPHTSLGVYSPYSLSLQIGNTGTPHLFSVHPEIQSDIENQPVLVDWILHRIVPLSSWRDTVSVKFSIPKPDGTKEDIVEIVVAGGDDAEELIEGVGYKLEKLIKRYQYNRPPIGSASVEYTPTGDPNFNEQNVQFTQHGTLTVSAMVPEPDPEPGTEPEPDYTYIPVLRYQLLGADLYKDSVNETQKISLYVMATEEFFNNSGKVGYQLYLQDSDTTFTYARTGITPIFSKSMESFVQGVEVRDYYIYERIKERLEQFSNNGDGVGLRYYARVYSLEGSPYEFDQYFLLAEVKCIKYNTNVTFTNEYTGVALNSIPALAPKRPTANELVPLDKIEVYQTSVGINIHYFKTSGEYYVNGTVNLGRNTSSVRTGITIGQIPLVAGTRIEIRKCVGVTITSTGEIKYFGRTGATYDMVIMPIDRTGEITEYNSRSTETSRGR